MFEIETFLKYMIYNQKRLILDMQDQLHLLEKQLEYIQKENKKST